MIIRNWLKQKKNIPNRTKPHYFPQNVTLKTSMVHDITSCKFRVAHYYIIWGEGKLRTAESTKKASSNVPLNGNFLVKR